jgi:type IV pilus assembly protein PilF
MNRILSNFFLKRFIMRLSYFCLAFSLVIVFIVSGCQMIATNPKNDCQNTAAANANVKLAIAFLNQGYTKEAKQKLLLAQKIAPKNPAVWYGMGYFQENTGSFDQAGKAYEKALRLAPKNGAAHNNYGCYLCRHGRYAESIKHFILAVQDPEYLDVGGAFENAGLCALKIPNKKLAIQFFKKALAQDPELATSRKLSSNLSSGLLATAVFASDARQSRSY